MCEAEGFLFVDDYSMFLDASGSTDSRYLAVNGDHHLAQGATEENLVKLIHSFLSAPFAPEPSSKSAWPDARNFSQPTAHRKEGIAAELEVTAISDVSGKPRLAPKAHKGDGKLTSDPIPGAIMRSPGLAKMPNLADFVGQRLGEPRMTDGEKHFAIAVFVAAAYCASLWMLNVTWWKAPIVGAMVGGAFLAKFSMRIISRSAVALLAISTLVWIDALPPPSQWKGIASDLASVLQSKPRITSAKQ